MGKPNNLKIFGSKKKQGPEGDSQIGRESPIPEGGEPMFFRKWPLSVEDDRGKTSPRALVFTRCDIQSKRL